MFSDFLYAHEAEVRVTCFAGVFAGIFVWEILAPRRTRQCLKFVRWFNNLGITTINTLILRIATPVAAVAAANLAQQQDSGLFNHFDLPAWLVIALAVIVLGSAVVFSASGFSPCAFFMASASHASCRP